MHARLKSAYSQLGSATRRSIHATVAKAKQTPWRALGVVSALSAATVAAVSATADDDAGPPSIPLTEEAKMYSSRQLGLFHPGLVAGEENQTSLKIDNITKLHIPHLSEQFPDLRYLPNRFIRTKLPALASEMKDPNAVFYNQIITDKDEVVLLDIVRRAGLSTHSKAFVRAGPRANVVWAPGEVKAAIVTCGGLCPGLNDVVEELVTVLHYNYGVDHIYGVRSGYRGFWQPDLPYIKLTPENVEGIHNLGGTVLGSSRGGFDVNKIMDACLKKGINQLYIIGGDGTHRAANVLYEEAAKRKLKMTVAAIPKTIDNDIGIIDMSFGFDTAVEEARKAIQSAVVEAKCAPNGVGIVKLMGRHAGYISAHATLASRSVDLCLIPEVEFAIDGPEGILTHMERILQTQGHGVIVVAEGAGTNHLQAVGATDESGNKVLPDVGGFLQSKLHQHFKSKGKQITIKYHDPSYMIRSVPANAADSVYCEVLAQNAVHGAMAGYTGFTSARVNNRTVYLPIHTVTATSPSYLNPNGRTWERVVCSTHQPNWSPASKTKAA